MIQLKWSMGPQPKVMAIHPLLEALAASEKRSETREAGMNIQRQQPLLALRISWSQP